MPATSERPAEAFEATKPPYECATRIFGPAIASRVDRTIVTSLLTPCRPRAGVTVAYPSLWSPATTRSHADGPENAPCTRTIVGRSWAAADAAGAAALHAAATQARMNARTGRIHVSARRHGVGDASSSDMQSLL